MWDGIMYAYIMFNSTLWLFTWLDNCLDGGWWIYLAKCPGMVSVLYAIHIEIFPRDLILQLAMHNNAVCAWVTNVHLLLKHVAHAILMLQVPTACRHSSTVKKYGTMLFKHSWNWPQITPHALKNFLGEHALDLPKVGWEPPSSPPTPCFLTLHTPIELICAS